MRINVVDIIGTHSQSVKVMTESGWLEWYH